jgi:hypothetical protein
MNKNMGFGYAISILEPHREWHSIPPIIRLLKSCERATVGVDGLGNKRPMSDSDRDKIRDAILAVVRVAERGAR